MSLPLFFVPFGYEPSTGKFLQHNLSLHLWNLKVSKHMPTLFTFGFGVCMIFTPCFVAMMNDIPPEKRGIASGLNSALRQFSATMGFALFGTLYSSLYSDKLNDLFQLNSST